MGHWLTSTFAALESRAYRTFWLGALLSFLGFFMSTIVQSVVAFELSGTNQAVGLAIFGQGIAMVILGFVGGALADRVSKRGILFYSQSFVAIVFLAVAVLLATDRLILPVLVGAAFCVGASISLLGPARQAYAPELVPPERVANAVALNQVALNASRVAGPALGFGFLHWETAGAAGAYFAMTGLYVLAVLTLTALPPPAARRRPEVGLLSDVVSGLRYVQDRPRLRLLVLYFLVVIMIGFPYVTVLPGLVVNALGGDVDSVTGLAALSAVGGLVASLGVARLADSPRAYLYFWAMGLLFGGSLIATAAASSVPMASLGMVGVGIGTGGFQTLNGAVVLRETEPAYYGRVMSLTLIAFGAFGLVGLPIGLLADAFGERLTLGGMGLTVCLISLGLTGVLARSHSHRHSRGR